MGLGKTHICMEYNVPGLNPNGSFAALPFPTRDPGDVLPPRDGPALLHSLLEHFLVDVPVDAADMKRVKPGLVVPDASP